MSRVFILMRSALLVLSFAALGGCKWFDSLVGRDPWSVFQDHRQKWQALGIKDYDYDLQMSCFCVVDAVAPVTITVENGVVVNVKNRTTGADVTNAPSVTWPTIDSLYQWRASFVRTHPGHVKFVYDGLYHFPGFASGDVPNIADEEFTDRITRFKPTVPPKKT